MSDNELETGIGTIVSRLNTPRKADRDAQRGVRRAAALNAVQLALGHSNRTEFSPSDADILVMIQDLLEKVAG